MSNINIVTLTGTLGRDVELRQTTRGTMVGRTALAVDHRTKEGGKRTTWLNLTLWGRTAEVAALYAGKGKRVAIVGHLASGRYEKDGQTHYTTDIVADTIEFLSPRTREAADGEPGTVAEPAATAPAARKAAA